MALSPRAYNEPVLPNEDLSRFAHLVLEQKPRFQLVDHSTGKAMDLPKEVYELLTALMAALANNQAVSVVPTNMEITTNQAADLLNVSRTYVIRLLDSGELRHRRVGTHRRVALTDALAYRDRMSQRTDKALDDLARIDEGLGLDD